MSSKSSDLLWLRNLGDKKPGQFNLYLDELTFSVVVVVFSVVFAFVLSGEPRCQECLDQNCFRRYC